MKPRTFEANRAFLEGEHLGALEISQSLAAVRCVANSFSGHQFASFASTAMDETTNF
jgi:hypothetical protein